MSHAPLSASPPLGSAGRARSARPAEGSTPGPAVHFVALVGRKINDVFAVVLPYVAPLPFLLSVFWRAFTRFWHSSWFWVPIHHGQDGHPGHPDDLAVGLTALLITIGCALPAILMITIKLLITDSLHSRQRVRLQMPTGAHAGGARAEALAFWNQEMDQVDERTSRVSRHLRMYSFLATTVFSSCTLILLVRFDAGPADAVQSVALAAGSAAMVAFLLDIGRIAVRSARRDASVRMFASATQRFLLIVTAAALLTIVALLGNFAELGKARPMTWIFLGAGMAFLGDRAAIAVGDRVASALKLPRSTVGEDSDLQRVEGITEENAARLGEEGILNLHALAFCSTPRLFLSTPYTLMELCDWQDQALLNVRLGPTKAAICRTQLLIRGATELMRLANEHARKELSDDAKKDLATLLGMPSLAQLDTLMHQAAGDPVAARLISFREAFPETYQEPDPPREE